MIGVLFLLGALGFAGWVWFTGRKPVEDATEKAIEIAEKAEEKAPEDVVEAAKEALVKPPLVADVEPVVTPAEVIPVVIPEERPIAIEAEVPVAREARLEMERIAMQAAATTEMELRVKEAETKVALEQAKATAEITPQYKPLSPEKEAGYIERAVPKNVYGKVCTTKACALEAAERQKRIAERQRSPGIRQSMLAIAVGMFEVAKTLP